MTLNLGNGLADPSRLVQVIHSSYADIVALQELDGGLASELEKTLSDIYPFQELHPMGIPGKGLLSKFAITDAELLALHPERPDLFATLEIPERRLRVIVAHPPPPRIRPAQRYENRLRLQQIDQLIDVATAEDATILLGDFNMMPWQADYRKFATAGLVDAFQVAGARGGATLPRRLQWMARSESRLSRITMPPFMRVDYILHTPDIVPLRAWTGAETGSDHLPVVADILLPEAPSIIVPQGQDEVRTEEPDLVLPRDVRSPAGLVLPGAARRSP